MYQINISELMFQKHFMRYTLRNFFKKRILRLFFFAVINFPEWDWLKAIILIFCDFLWSFCISLKKEFDHFLLIFEFSTNIYRFSWLDLTEPTLVFYSQELIIASVWRWYVFQKIICKSDYKIENFSEFVKNNLVLLCYLLL